VGSSALCVAEFAGRQTLYRGGPDRQGHHFPAADLPCPFIFCIPPIVKEVLGALLMHDVEQRTTHNHEYHDDDIRLHDDGRYERRKLGEGIAGEHLITPMLASYYQREISMAWLLRKILPSPNTNLTGQG
jgi:hypothetical protein